MTGSASDHRMDALTRRVLLGGLSAAVLSRFGPASARAEGETLRFGLTPVFLTSDLQLLDALRAYLEKATGFPVELIRRRTYQEVTALLVSGELDAAWICGFPYVQHRAELSLVAIPLWNGEPVYQSYLIAGAGRKADGISDLAGDIHAFSDPDSNSGYLVTRALLHEIGREPDTFFRKTIFTYGHRNVIRAVSSGLAQSGSVDGYVWEVLKDIEPKIVGGTRIVRKSEWLGFPPIATGKALAGSEKIRRLSSALLTMRDDAEGRFALDLLRLTGFGEPNDGVFDGIAAKVAALGSTP